MNRKLSTLMGLGMFLFTTPLMGQQFPYQDPNLTPEQRASDLLGRLTLEEKAAFLTGKNEWASRGYAKHFTRHSATGY